MKDSRIGFRNNLNVCGGERPAKRQSIQRCQQDLWVMWSRHWKPPGTA